MRIVWDSDDFQARPTDGHVSEHRSLGTVTRLCAWERPPNMFRNQQSSGRVGR